MGNVVDYRGGSQINAGTEVGDSMSMDESGMEFPVVDLTASRIQKKMKKKQLEKQKKMKNGGRAMETTDCCHAPGKENC